MLPHSPQLSTSNIPGILSDNSIHTLCAYIQEIPFRSTATATTTMTTTTGCCCCCAELLTGRSATLPPDPSPLQRTPPPFQRRFPNKIPSPLRKKTPPFLRRLPPPSEEDPPHPYPIDAVWPTPQWFTMTGRWGSWQSGHGLRHCVLIMGCHGMSWDGRVKWWDLTGCT